MKRNLKALGLVLTAVFAFGALASAAQAEGEFHSSASNTILTGEADPTEPSQIFEITDVGTVECNHVRAEGDIRGATTADHATVAFKYGKTVEGETKEKCDSSLSGANSVDVTDEGCHYNFHSETTGGHAPVDLTGCTNGGVVMDFPFGCSITVPNQTVADAVHYTNKEANGHKTITGEVTATNAVEYEASFACQLIGVPASGDADYTGKFTVGGYEDNGGTGVLTGGAGYSMGEELDISVG